MEHTRKLRRYLSANTNPGRVASWVKAIVMFAYCWHLISADTTQLLINHFQLWSA
jgi:hypothetical protein